MKSAKRKSAKKKSVKKKSVRKRAAKKSKKRKLRPTTVVILDPAVPLGDDERFLSRSNKDVVCWLNLDGKDHKIVFVDGKWPFEGKQKKIKVKAGRLSKRMVTNWVDKGPYEYSIDPPMEYVVEVPPDGPAIIVND